MAQRELRLTGVAVWLAVAHVVCSLPTCQCAHAVHVDRRLMRTDIDGTASVAFLSRREHFDNVDQDSKEDRVHEADAEQIDNCGAIENKDWAWYEGSCPGKTWKDQGKLPKCRTKYGGTAFACTPTQATAAPSPAPSPTTTPAPAAPPAPVPVPAVTAPASVSTPAIPTCPDYVYSGYCNKNAISGGVACIGNGAVQCVPGGGRNLKYKCPSGMTKCLGPEQQAVTAMGAGVCYNRQCGCPGNFKETGCTAASFMPGWCSGSAQNCGHCQGSWCTEISEDMAAKTCTPPQCEKCSKCLNEAAAPLSACVTKKLVGARCFDPVHQYCDAWSGCEQLGYGCLVKLMCPHPCVCDSWKKVFCDSATTLTKPQDTAKCENLNSAMIQQSNASLAINTGSDATAKGRERAPLSLMASSLKQRSLTSIADSEDHALDSSLDGKCAI